MMAPLLLIHLGLQPIIFKNPVVKVEAYTSTNLGSVAAESSILTYKMLGQSGQEVQATSLVFTPNTPPPVGGWPIVVWGAWYYGCGRCLRTK